MAVSLSMTMSTLPPDGRRWAGSGYRLIRRSGRLPKQPGHERKPVRTTRVARPASTRATAASISAKPGSRTIRCPAPGTIRCRLQERFAGRLKPDASSASAASCSRSARPPSIDWGAAPRRDGADRGGLGSRPESIRPSPNQMQQAVGECHAIRYAQARGNGYAVPAGAQHCSTGRL